jgi:hypothetical protein
MGPNFGIYSRGNKKSCQFFFTIISVNVLTKQRNKERKKGKMKKRKADE